MNQEQKVIRVKVGVLELAKQLGNVSAACRARLPRLVESRARLEKAALGHSFPP